MKVFIDGTPLSNPSANLLEPKFSLRRKTEDEEVAVSFTGELTFIGTDYDYIYNKLVLAPNGINDSVELKFIDDCCSNKEYLFLIKPESLRWCDNSCELTANAVEYNASTRAYTCLENTLIWDNTFGFQSKAHPKVTYCLEFRPSILQDLLLIVGLFTVFGATTILAMLVTLILPLVTIVNVIIAAINLIPGVNVSPLTIGGFSDPTQMLSYIFNTFTQTNGQLIAGCGYEHPSPLVRDYITNFCAKCNLGFSSSILDEPNPSKPNNEYFNLVYFSAPIKGGRISNPYFVKPIVPFIDENKPIHNGKTFMDELKEPFNGGWDVSNGVLRFERKDFFQNQAPWFDATTYDSSKIISQCFEWSSQRRPAYADIGYQRDPVDWVGSEAYDQWKDIIEWNLPINPIQKGDYTKIFPYSTARFRRDGLERDVLESYDWMPFGIGANIKKYNSSMIMNNGTSWTPKLLCWDYLDINNATIQSYNKGGYARAYNYPMWVNANYPGNLYDRFWKIEDPRNTSFSGFDFEIQVLWDCTLLNSVDLTAPIMTSRGLSKTILSVDLDFETTTLTIRGTI